MAKKIVVDNTQVPRNTISGAGKGPNSASVASVMMTDNDLISSPRTKTGMKGKDIEDDLQSEEGGDVVDAEQVVSDSVNADSEYQILLAQADVTLPSNTSTPDLTRGEEGAGFFSSQSANWWMAGTGVVIAGAGVGLALSSDNGDSGVTVTPNAAPVITTGATGSVVENAAISTVIYDAAATDADAGTTITYSLKAATGDVATLDINATTGQVTLKASADFETKSSYSFTVIASDGTNSSEQAVTVAVADVDEFDVTVPVDSDSAANSVAENAANGTTVGVTASASDSDASTNTITYTLVDDLAGTAYTGNEFAIGSSGVVTVAGPIDREAGATRTVFVKATSADGSTAVESFTINVSDVDEFNVSTPVDSDAINANRVDENAAGGGYVGLTASASDADATNNTVTYSLVGAADGSGSYTAGEFTIDSSGMVTSLGTGADYEAGATRTLFVKATSTDGSSAVSSFTITITNVNEVPVITSNGSGASASVNVAEGVATVTTVTATDVDAGDSQTYSISGGLDAAKFAINSITGALTFITAPDFEAPADNDGNNVYDVQVKVTDNDALFDVQDIAVTVTDVSPEPPIFSSGGIGSVNENIPVSSLIYDANTDSEGFGVSYSLSGTDAGLFSINPSTGEVANIDSVNFETKATYSFTVVANNGGAISEQPVIVTVNDVNEAPVITSNGDGDNASIDVVENQTAITTVTASDPDLGASKTYSLTGGADMGLFSINPATGVLIFNSAQNYEAPADTDLNNAYDVQVTVSDGTLTDMQNITVNVTDYNEASPVFINPSDLYVSEGTVAFIVSATDADTFQTRIYSLGGPDAGKFTINQSTGEVTFNTTPDYENPENVDNTYNLTVTATDNGTDPGSLFTTQNFTVHVTDAVEDVVVEAGGAFLDFNGNGVKDAEDNVRADFQDPTAPGYINLANQITIHYNAAPNNPLNLSGFGSDDLIEIDAQAFIDNGHNALNILALTNIKTLDEFNSYTANTSSFVYNRHILINSSSGTSYANSNSYTGVSANFIEKIGLDLRYNNTTTRTLLFFSANRLTSLPVGSNTNNWVLASGLPTDMPLQDVVDFVNLPVPSAIVHVVVDSDGAVIDIDGDGVRDIGENRLANFGTNGNADLAGKSVVIQFNDAPSSALTLAGFGTDDLIEIDAQAFYANGYQGAALFGRPDAKDFNAYETYSYIAATDSGFSQGFNTSGSAEYNYLWNPSQGSGFQLWYAKSAKNLSFSTYNISSKQLAYSLPSALSGWSPLQDMVDFVNLPKELQIVVDQRGAFFDANANGVVDGDEWSNPADFDPTFGNVFVGYNHVTVHYNDVPNGDINLSGFGSDDLIEIDVQAFIDNGHNALQILNQPNISTLDALHNALLPTGTGPIFYPNSSSPITINYLAHSRYSNLVLQEIVTPSGSHIPTMVSAGIYNSSMAQSLFFFSYHGMSGQLGTQLQTDLPIWQMVDYVNLPPAASDTAHVVVDSFYGYSTEDGFPAVAVIDYDGDGVRDAGENWLADFGIGGNADLANKSVTVHFNNIPMSALNLTGFGTDDKIEIDTGDDTWIDGFSVGASSVLFGMAHHSYISGPTPIITTAKTGIRFKQGSITFSSDSGSGTIAYWNDSTNALNVQNNLLPNYTTSPGNYSEVLADLNTNHYPGLVEFIWPVKVVVDDEAGHVASFIDANANGLRDAGENTLALLGQTQADVDAFNTAAGTSYGSQVVDLASENVTIHYNDLPTGNWVPDLTGFDGNDRIEIDADALRRGTDVALSGQNRYDAYTWTDSLSATGGTNYNSRLGTYSAVFLSGSKLLYGHTSSNYTATGMNEGTIASNAAALAGHYQQQVVFVMEPTSIE